MKLNQHALAKLNTPTIRRKLMEAFEVVEPTIIRWIKSNHDNLTKAAALKVIRETTGLTDEEILETETVNQKGVTI